MKKKKEKKEMYQKSEGRAKREHEKEVLRLTIF